MTNKKDDQIQVEVSTYNWGPCVVKVKILDDFKKVLLEEAKKNEEDYASKLAGQIRKETGYSEESRNKNITILIPIPWCVRYSVSKISKQRIRVW